MRTAVLLACAALGSLSASAGEKKPTVKNLAISAHWGGPAYDARSAKSRVVVVVFWGYRCPRCHVLLPRLAKLDRQLRGEGLVMLGVHCQGLTAKDKALQVIKKARAEFGIYGRGRILGVSVQSLPRVCVFDHRGQMIYDGTGSKVEGVIRKAVAAVPPPLPGPGKFPRMARVAVALSTLRNLGTAVKLLEASAKHKDKAVAAEARTLLSRTRTYGVGKLTTAAALKTTDPEACVRLYQEVAGQFAGCDIADRANKALEALRTSKQFQLELAGAAAMTKVRPLEGKLRPYRGKSDPRDAGFRKANRAVLNNLLRSCQIVTKHYKGTAAAREAQKLHDTYK